MGFEYVVEKVNQNGATEQTVTKFPWPEVVFGRGGDSQIIFTSRKVSLTHAKVYVVGGKIFIEDLKSIAGTRIDGRLVESARIRGGEEIQLGDVTFRVELHLEDDKVVFFHRPVETVDTEKEGESLRILGALELSRYVPPIRILVLVACLLAAVLLGLAPHASRTFASWTSGPVANAHKMIEADCLRCHSQPFHPIQDQDCLKCHSMTDHAPDYAAITSRHPQYQMRCAECHMDHNGDAGIITRDSALCGECHARLNELAPERVHPHLASFDYHPQFRVKVPANGVNSELISLDDKAKLKDTTPIKLNHAVHLKKGLIGMNGPVTLGCKSCHDLSTDLKTVQPITFEKNCQSCHPLGFDNRLPNSEVVHGDDAAVFPALFTEYTKLLLMKDADGVVEPETPTGGLPAITRKRPGAPATPPPPVLTETARGVNVSEVVKSARDAERELYTKTACFLCHQTSLKPDNEQRDGATHYVTVKPQIPDKWMTQAKFSHGAHDEVSCESCHDKTRESTSTEDVLLPKVESCRDCHSQVPRRGFVTSDCILCHSFHDSRARPESAKSPISEYIRKLPQAR